MEVYQELGKGVLDLDPIAPRGSSKTSDWKVDRVGMGRQETASEEAGKVGGEGKDPLQSPIIFKNPKGVPEKARSLSFAAATKASHQIPNFPSIPVRSPVDVNGEEVVQFTNEEVSKMASAFTRTIIGKFSTGRPAMIEILNSLKNAIQFAEEIFPVAIDQRHILIRFLNRDDFVKAYIKEA